MSKQFMGRQTCRDMAVAIGSMLDDLGFTLVHIRIETKDETDSFESKKYKVST
jgi:hypothetical protein